MSLSTGTVMSYRTAKSILFGAILFVLGGLFGWMAHPDHAASQPSVTATICHRGYIAANSGNEPLGDNNTGPQAVIQTTAGEYAIYPGWMRDLKEGNTYRFTYTQTANQARWVSAVPQQVKQGAACS